MRVFPVVNERGSAVSELGKINVLSVLIKRDICVTQEVISFEVLS